MRAREGDQSEEMNEEKKGDTVKFTALQAAENHANTLAASGEGENRSNVVA